MLITLKAINYYWSMHNVYLVMVYAYNVYLARSF